MLKLCILLFLSSVMMIMTQHPLVMAIILMINTLLTALITGTMNLNYWYSFMLFMIMIGGMLVLVMYMTTVASNEMLETMMKFLPIMMLSMLIIVLPDFMEINTPNNTFDISMNMMKQNLSLSKFISMKHLPVIILLINYLLITLIAIVKITSPKHGSLRQKI